jgi:Holliday junction resolvase RusA-like endonuclease
MNQPETIRIEGQGPTTNHAYRRRGNGPGMYMTSAGDAWKALVGAEVGAQRHRPLQGWAGRDLEIDLFFGMRRPLSRDWDGMIKLTQDAVAGALGFNDNRIWDGHVRRRRRTMDYLVVTIRENPMEEDPR